jgi:hypothetical protein
MLRLTLCGDAQLEDIKSNADLMIGDHLVLPVNNEAEGRLTALRDNLKGLPSDLESSVLNIIRRPSLEWRLDRIESRLSMPPATRAEQQRSRVQNGTFLDRLYDLVMRQVPIGPAFAAALLLTAGTLFAYDKFFHPAGAVEASSKDPGALPAAPAPHAPPPPPPAKPEPTEAEASLADLFKSLEMSEEPHIHGLYATHFKGHQEEAFKNSNVSWGITKLQALELGLVGKSNPIMGDVSAGPKTEKIYRDEGNLSILRNHQNAVDLLAYTWCQSTNTPALPVTSTYKEPLPLKGTCDDVKPEDAVLGLEALTDWVKKQKKPKK